MLALVFQNKSLYFVLHAQKLEYVVIFLFSIFFRDICGIVIYEDLNNTLNFIKNTYKRDILKCRGEILKILERRFNFW